jgi:hypothetical protein
MDQGGLLAMSFEQLLRDRIAKAPFRSKEKDILKVVLGDVQLKAASGKVSDETCHNIVKSMIKNNTEKVLAVLKPDDHRRAGIEEENRVLQTLLPKYLTLDEAEKALREATDPAGLVEEIQKAKSEGQATGVAMKYFKGHQMNIEGETVKAVVNKLRA